MRRLSPWLLALASLIWGLAFVAQRDGADYLGAYTFNGIRFLVGAASLLPVLAVFERKQVAALAKTGKPVARSLGLGAGAGVILFLAANFQQIGIERTGSAGKAGFLTALYIVFVPVCGVFTRKKIEAFVWVGAVLALVGTYLLSVSGNDVGVAGITSGDVFLVICAVFWTAHILYIDKFAPGVPPILFSFVQFAFVGAVSLAYGLATESVTAEALRGAVMPIFYCGVFSSGVAYTLQVIGQRHVEPGKAAVIFSGESLFSGLGAAFVLGEILPLIGYIGCGLIFGGILLSQLGGILPSKKRTKIRFD